MNHNCYIPIRDFGVDGWRLFPASLLISDRIDLWLPDGGELQKAFEEKKCKFSPANVLEMVDAGLVQIAGREFNFEKSNIAALNKSGETFFDQGVRDLYREGRICLHKNYPGARIAKEELDRYITSKDKDERAIHSSRLSTALKYIDLSKQESAGKNGLRYAIPEIARIRANQFLNMDSDEIGDENIRETFKLIKSSFKREEDKVDYAVATQLVRLSIEHASIKINQQCDIHAAEANHAAIYSDVSGSPGVIQKGNFKVEENLNLILELIDFLIARRAPKSTQDFLDMHQEMSKYRRYIWNLSITADNPIESISTDLDSYISQQGTITKAFGSEKIGKSLSLLGAADLIRATIVAAISMQLGVEEFISLALGMALPAYSIYKKNKEEDMRIWPIIAVLNSRMTTKENLRIVQQDLEYFRNIHF